ncbi:protein of unknown function [Micromonospora echinospora]|uniref:DUF397 domain-containing protein n=1 Tax=Micromonospora echinospora TaxID=1877 RepID=A0A1C4Z1N2_MICEC|nr:protein of unknown function [Micromonospora echinospora]
MDLTGAIWRKSSRSSGNGGDCVEVADNLAGVVGVRDRKDPHGPALTSPPPPGGPSSPGSPTTANPVDDEPAVRNGRRLNHDSW